MLKMFNRKNKKGFTLTELIVVVAILGILAAVSVPMVTGYLASAKTSTDAVNAKAMEGVIKRALADGKMNGIDIVDLASATTSGVAAEITTKLGVFPANNTTGNLWQYNINTAVVTSVAVAGAASYWKTIP